MRIVSWSPLSPKEVLALADKPNLKLVTSTADLCEVLATALEQFAAELHGAQTPVRDLWDRQGTKNIFPGRRERLVGCHHTLPSEGIGQRRNLCQSGGRSQARARRACRSTHRYPRQRGSTPSGRRIIRPDRRCARDQRLLEQRIVHGPRRPTFPQIHGPLRAQAGIYLVGWFDTDKWDPEDSRLNSVPKTSISEAKAQLDRQANALSDGFVVRTVILECRVPKMSE